MHEAPHSSLADDDDAEISRAGLTAWFDDPELLHDLRDARRVLRIELHRLQNAPAADGQDTWDCPWPIHAGETAPPQARTSRSRLGGLAWFILCCGAMLLVCGGVLLGLSHFTPRPDLWNPGLLAALCGQFLVVLGLVSRRGQAASVRSKRVESQRSESQLIQVLPWRIPLGDAGLTARSA